MARSIRIQLLRQNLITIALAMVLVVGLISVTMLQQATKQAHERLTLAARSVERAINTNSDELCTSAKRIISDKDLSSKTNYIQENTGKSEMKSMVIQERANLAVRLGRAMAAAGATDASLYGVDGVLLCASVVAGDRLRLCIPDDNQTNKWRGVLLEAGKEPQPDDWKSTEILPGLIVKLSGPLTATASVRCEVEHSSWHLKACAPIMAETLNAETFQMQIAQRGLLFLAKPLDAAFLAEETARSGMLMNLYAQTTFVIGDAPDLAINVTDLKSSSQAPRNGLDVQGVRFSSNKAKGDNCFIAILPMLADGSDAGAISIMMSQKEMNANVRWIVILTIGAGVLAALGAVLLGIFLTKSITVPIMNGVNGLTAVAVHGDLSAEMDTKTLRRQDEIGQLSQAVEKLLRSQREQVAMAKSLAQGNWNVSIPIRSDQDELGLSLQSMVDQMNEMLLAVNSAAKEVQGASEQISDASQSLSQGATESAASLQEVTSSMTQIGAQSSQNVQSAQEANRLATEAQGAAGKGSTHMGEMVTAIRDINDSSQAIAKILKAIEDISFQTNLLALNAAIEAARAGRHGKGFAVVADEVRSLASRSAKQAQESAAIIETLGEKVKKGTTIADETAKALEEIVAGITNIAALAGEISTSSNQQAAGVQQVGQGMDQIQSVTQRNAAFSEETASAAQELSAQARSLQELLAKFQLRQG